MATATPANHGGAGATDGSLVLRYLREHRQGIALAAGLFAITFIAYYFTNHENTYFRAFVYAGNSFLDGRFDVPDAVTLYHYNDWAAQLRDEGPYYLVEPIVPALILLPGIAIWGIALNQTLASIVIASLNASNIQRVVGHLTEKLSARVILALFFLFGTNYWWASVNGSTTQFTHTTSVLFLFAAIYVTLVSRAPLLAGIFLGLAHLCRLPTVLSLPFFIIMFSEQWLPASRANATSLIRRVDLTPIIKLGLGVGVLVGLGMIYNYLTMECSLGLPCQYEHYVSDDPNDQYGQKVRAGLFGLKHIPEHFPGIFAGLPIFRLDPAQEPYVIPSWAGLSFWATTPAFLLAFYAGAKNLTARRIVTALIIIAVTGIILSNSYLDPSPGGLDILPFELNLPYGIEYWPFAALILCGLFFGLRDKFTMACWLAIIPIGLLHTTYAFSGGWPQFGDRFALDYYPFLFLLTVRGIGNELKWYHLVLIGLSILINFWGVFAIYKGSGDAMGGWTWVDWG